MLVSIWLVSSETNACPTLDRVLADRQGSSRETSKIGYECADRSVLVVPILRLYATSTTSRHYYKLLDCRIEYTPSFTI